MSSNVFKNFNENSFVLDMSSDLIQLSEILNRKNNVCISTGGINRLASQLRSKNNFEYKLKPMEFNFIDYPKNLPHKNINNLRLFFDINLSGEYKKIPEYKDPLRSLEFNVSILGNIDSQKLFYSLHLDRHIHDGKSPSNEIHPIYHFQFGGKKIDDEEIDRGGALFMDVPRIMHHPMDIFLGIDFILSNFFPKIWKKFKQDGTYNNIMRKYQSYFVYPYFKTVVRHFEESTSQPWNSKDIYPQLIEVKY